MLAEIALPGSIRSQQAAFGVHPALLDACFQSVAAIRRARQSATAVCCCRWACGSCAPTRPPAMRAIAYARVTASPPGLDADLDLIDAHGTVLLTARGLQMGTGASEQQPRSAAQREPADHRVAASTLPEAADDRAG